MDTDPNGSGRRAAPPPFPEKRPGPLVPEVLDEHGGQSPPDRGGPFGPRGFAGGRVRVYGCSPGCLLTSLIVSILLTLLLNLLL